jgi:hypothetical protein
VVTVDDAGTSGTGTARFLGPLQAALAAPGAAHLLRPPRATPAAAVDAAIGVTDGKVARASGRKGANGPGSSTLHNPTGKTSNSLLDFGNICVSELQQVCDCANV